MIDNEIWQPPEVANEVDILVRDPRIMRHWREHIRQTLGRDGGIKTLQDLFAAATDPKLSLGAYYTIVAITHDDLLSGMVPPIITDDFENVNAQICGRQQRSRKSRSYGSTFHLETLKLYLVHVKNDLEKHGLIIGDKRKGTDEVKKTDAEEDRQDKGPLRTESELTDTETYILEALGKKTLRGPELLKKAGYDNSSHYRTILSNLVKRGILGRTEEGYFSRVLTNVSDKRQD